MKSGRAGEQSLAPFALYVGLIERPTRHRGSHMPRRYVYNGNICVMHVEQRQGAEPSHVFSTAPMRNNVTAPASFETDDHDEMVAWLKKNARGALLGCASCRPGARDACGRARSAVRRVRRARHPLTLSLYSREGLASNRCDLCCL